MMISNCKLSVYSYELRALIDSYRQLELRLNSVDHKMDTALGKLDQLDSQLGRLLQHQDLRVRELGVLLGSLNESNLDRLFELITALKDVELSSTEIADVVTLTRHGLAKHHETPGFVDKAAAAFNNWLISFSAGAAGAALMVPDQIDVHALSLAGGSLGLWLGQAFLDFLERPSARNDSPLLDFNAGPSLAYDQDAPDDPTPSTADERIHDKNID